MRIFPGCFLLILVLSGIELRAAPGFVERRAALAHRHVTGAVRIHYDLEGDHAVDPRDLNGNGLPDAVEDVATQIQAAWGLWIEGLEFPDPLKSPRFAAAAFVDVHLLSREALGSNGLAYDELQRFDRPGDPPGTRTLCFDVATSVMASRNLTPAHELFHLIQNGACFFKNRWYTEGTARWSEAGLGEGGLGKGLRASWPTPPKVLEGLGQMSYDAAPQFWDPLALAVDREGRIPADRISPELREMRYVDGRPVLADLELHGWEFVRDLLAELDRVDDDAASDRGLSRWAEAEQKSSQNTPYLVRAMKTVLERHGLSWPTGSDLAGTGNPAEGSEKGAESADLGVPVRPDSSPAP